MGPNKLNCNNHLSKQLIRAKDYSPVHLMNLYFTNTIMRGTQAPEDRPGWESFERLIPRRSLPVCRP